MAEKFGRVPIEDIPIFQADPLREEKLGWIDAIVCRFCGRKFQKLPMHILAEHRDELLEGADDTTSHGLLLMYRRRFGFSKNASLLSKDVQQRMRQNLQNRNSRRKHQGRTVQGIKFRGGRNNKTHKEILNAALQARKEWGTSPQARQRFSITTARVAKPDRWKRNADGTPISDWQIGQCRLKGKKLSEITTHLAQDVIRKRLKQMGFPSGRTCRFFRGEPVTEKLLRSHYEDLKFVRVFRHLPFDIGIDSGGPPASLKVPDLAALLNVDKAWIYRHTRSCDNSQDKIPHSHSAGKLTFTLNEVLKWVQKPRDGRNKFFGTFDVEQELVHRLGVGRRRVYEFLVHPGGPFSRRDPRAHRRPNHPLSCRLADRLLASMASLRQEFRQIGSTVKGGRPKALMPSEEKELPEKYQALKADLHLMLTWAEREGDVITLNRLGEWMCKKARRRELRVLLFWTSLHALLPAICERARNRAHGGGLGSAERAKEFVCQEYGISRPQLVKAINKTALVQLAA